MRRVWRVLFFSLSFVLSVTDHIECGNSDNLLVETKLRHCSDEINLRTNMSNSMADKSSWAQETRGIAYCSAIGRLARLFYRDVSAMSCEISLLRDRQP